MATAVTKTRAGGMTVVAKMNKKATGLGTRVKFFCDRRKRGKRRKQWRLRFFWEFLWDFFEKFCYSFFNNRAGN